MDCAIKINDNDFNALEGKREKRGLQGCNICCNIATKRAVKTRKKSGYGINYRKLTNVQRYATNNSMNATMGTWRVSGKGRISSFCATRSCDQC
jgi:hypothetical protein